MRPESFLTTTEPPDGAGVLTEVDAAHFVGVAASTLATMRREGRAPAWFIYPGSRAIRYLRSEVDSWIARQAGVAK